MFDPYEVRKDFPILEREINGYKLIYFDNAATSQKPIQVIEAIKDFYEKHNANVHRGVHTLSQEASELYETAHEEAAKFINADGMEEIVFVKNTTEAINLVAYSWALNRLGEKDEVLTTLLEHHSNIVPWEMLSKVKGFKVRYADVNADGTLNYESLEEQLTEKTRVVCISHVSNVTGAINDIGRVAKLAHDYNAIIVVDGAQSVPHIPIDVKGLDIDFLAFSGHKMLGPTGIGVLYGKKELFEEMEPFLGGGNMIKSVRCSAAEGPCQIEWHDLPWKFEAGTPNICGGVGLMEAIRYLRKLGMENVHRHECELTEYALKRFEEFEKVEFYGPRDVSIKCGIIPFNVDGMNPHDVALLLDGFGIMVRSGYHCAEPLHRRLGIKGSARASFYIYNTKEEIDRFIEVLKGIENVGR
ncbi:cysteine desulfurase [Candidatus Bathyarchaeota archaeon]|nr:MAG: cysteine desulfurase [Candidatus Bathyarchaeota archaeon]